MKATGRAFVLAAVWLSPAALLGLGPLLLADGIRGLWAPLVLAGGALLVVLLLAGPWSRRVGTSPPTLLALTRERWPAAGRVLAPLAIGDAGSALLFLWAQLAAGRELAQTLDWSLLAALGVAALVLATWRDAVGPRLAVFGGVLALLGLALPLAVVQAATTPWWPRVWAEVASRPRVIFSESGAWTTEGRPIRGVGREATVSFTDEQRVTLLGRGRVRVGHWEGGESRREVTSETQLTLRPGDRLVVPDGFPLRFQGSRRVPGAPPSGPDWVDPPGGRSDWRAMVGLGVTLLFGAVGLPAVHAALPAEPSLERHSARAGALLVILGVVLAMFWVLYAAWLTPEIYTAGVVGVEVYELPGSLAGLEVWGRPLRLLALIGLAAGGVAAALMALRGLPRELPARLDYPRAPALAAVAIAGTLAAVAPAPPWSLLLASFGLSASAGAPAAVLGCWSEQATARGLAAGASLGLVLFGGLLVVALWGTVGLHHAPDSSWLAWFAAWPAVVAMPANALAAWFVSSRPETSPRSPLSPGLAALHE